jgi:hypothetical protein
MKEPKEGLSIMSPRLTRFTQLLTLSLTAFATVAVQAMPAASPRTHRLKEHVPGEIVIKFRDAASSRAGSAAVMATLTQRLGSKAVQEMHSFVTDQSLALVRLKNDSLTQTALKILEGEPTVVFSEPNFIYHTLDLAPSDRGAPNDADFAKQWSMLNTGQKDMDGLVGIAGDDINVLPLWQNGIVGKKNTLVAVIDTGIQWDHPDLASNIYTNTGEIAGNNKDDDNNGFVDDIHGWSFVDNKNTSSDDNGHGTHCAGVIGAVGNDGKGVAGINWNVSLLPVKFLDASGGGSLESAVNAINYARLMKVSVMSNSWGGGGFSQAMFDAIKAAQDQGILFVAAAGNDGLSNDGDSPTYPAAYDLANIVAVAATDNNDGLAPFSNYGVKRVHVAAPGVNIYSTYMGSAYQTLSGTSMATPHVAGISTLLFSEHPEWSYGEIKDRLIKTSTPARALRRKVMARGRVNAYNAMYGIIPPNPDPAETLWQSKDQLIESVHPYDNDTDKTWTVSVPGAKYIRLHFEKIDTEMRFDSLTIAGPHGEAVDLVSGTEDNYTSEYFQGDTLVIHLKSDNSVQHWGFKMDKVQYIMETAR